MSQIVVLLILALSTLVLPRTAAAADATVATVGSRNITSAELEKHVKPKLLQIENERYEALRDGLDEMIAAELMSLEAKARGVTPEALEKSEITDKAGKASDAEVEKVYNENKEALEGAPLDSVRPRIVAYVDQQRAAHRHEDFLNELRAKYKTKVSLEAPIIKVETAGRPQRGGEKAPVTIIEFSDYECPFCKRAEPTVEQVLKTYGDQVRLVYRDFPLEMHEHARDASQAAKCANAQGKFWDYHAKLFTSEELDRKALDKIADDLKLDRAKFDECVTKQDGKAEIDQDIADGQSAGVSGTPAFFINGRMMAGAKPFESFKAVIDEEIAKSKPEKAS
jgi:protein-disulfide isomerase